MITEQLDAVFDASKKEGKPYSSYRLEDAGIWLSKGLSKGTVDYEMSDLSKE